MARSRNNVWRKELKNLAITLAIATVIGYFLDILPWALFIGNASYIYWHLLQMVKVNDWLAKNDGSSPPESYGIWGLLMDRIYRIQRLSLEKHTRLQATVDYLQESFASLPDATVMISEGGEIEWSNREAERVFDLKYPKDIGQTLTNLVRDPDFVQFIESEDYHSPPIIESPVINGLQLQIQVAYFGDNNRLVFARDVTENQRLLQMRKDFVANVSHELRTPLTVILGYVEAFADADVFQQPPWQKAVEQIRSQALRMENLVKDLIVLSRIETFPELEMEEELNVSKLLTMIREEALALIENRIIEIDADPLLNLVGNPNELRSAFTNLVVNAVKYTNDNGYIKILWNSDEHFAYLSVIDNGDGIAPHHLSRLTERFYRVDQSRTTTTGGTGLGLAITKHILRRHQAELKISSVVGQGSTFTCIFPLERVRSKHTDN